MQENVCGKSNQKKWMCIWGRAGAGGGGVGAKSTRGEGGGDRQECVTILLSDPAFLLLSFVRTVGTLYLYGFEKNDDCDLIKRLQ